MPPKNKPNLTDDQRKQIVSQLLLLVETGSEPPKLGRGALTSVANEFDVVPKTVSRVWKRALEAHADPNIRAFRASPRIQKHSGRPKKHGRGEEVRRKILLQQVPTQPRERKSLRTIAAAIGVPLTTLHHMKQEDNGVLIPHSIAQGTGNEAIRDPAVVRD